MKYIFYISGSHFGEILWAVSLQQCKTSQLSPSSSFLVTYNHIIFLCLIQLTTSLFVRQPTSLPRNFLVYVKRHVVDILNHPPSLYILTAELYITSFYVLFKIFLILFIQLPNQVHVFPSYFFMMQFNITFPSKPRSSKWCVSFSFCITTLYASLNFLPYVTCPN